jgi:hypothetical protein
VLFQDVDAYLPRSGDTVHRWLITAFEMQKQEIRRQLHEEPVSKIHLSFDLWTSENQLALLGIVAHYLDKKSWTNQSRLISLRRIQGAHSGENLASYLLAISEEYEITDRLGYFTLDNASSNDTCLRTFLPTCNPDITHDGIVSRRLRCFGHVLNLAAKAFLYGKNADALEVENNANEALNREREAQEAWRRHSPIGKLHNVIVAVRITPQRKKHFARISNLEEPDYAAFELNKDTQKLGIIQNNDTRWNSTYNMINRALKKRREIDSFITRLDDETEASKRIPLEDHLSNNDWLILVKTAALLKPFYTITMRLQGHAGDATHGAIWEVLPATELLLSGLEAAKLTYRDPTVLDNEETIEIAPIPIDPEILPPAHSTRRRRRQPQPPTSPQQPPQHQQPQPNENLSDATRKHLRTAINNAWEKLDHYYQLCDASPVYVASVVLHPGQKWRYFEKKWGHNHQDWLANAKDETQALYETQYKNREMTEIQATQNITQRAPRQPDEFETWITPVDYYETDAVTVDEYDAYLSTPPIPTLEPILWWRDHQSTYPRLSQMAFDLLSIPAMSAECERVFSQARLTISTQRVRLKEDTIDAIQCLKNWLRGKAISEV